MGFLEGLTILFIALKLTHVITWSWFLVVAPLYPAAILYVVLAICGVGIFKRGKREIKKFDAEFERMNWPRGF